MHKLTDIKSWITCTQKRVLHYGNHLNYLIFPFFVENRHKTLFVQILTAWLINLIKSQCILLCAVRGGLKEGGRWVPRFSSSPINPSRQAEINEGTKMNFKMNRYSILCFGVKLPVLRYNYISCVVYQNTD